MLSPAWVPEASKDKDTAALSFTPTMSLVACRVDLPSASSRVVVSAIEAMVFVAIVVLNPRQE